jgi:RHS repeat-associated protein
VLLSPSPGQTALGAVTQFIVQFSEAMQDSGSNGQHSVTNPAAYQLYGPGPNGVFDGGGGDDVAIGLSGVSYNPHTLQATVQIDAASSPLADGAFQIRVAASSGAYALRDLAGNPLGGGADLVSGFSVNRVGPINLSASALSGAEGQALTLTASFDNPGSSGSHSATIDWGDGSSQPASVTFANGHGQLTAQHTYPDNSSYSIHIQVSDDSLPASVPPSSVDTTATISNVAPSLTVSANRTVSAGAAVSLLVGTFTDPGFDNPSLSTHESFSASINWGDGSAATAGVVTVTQGSAGVLTTGQVVGTHTYATVGTFQVTVTLTDDDGGSSQGTFSLTTQHRFAVVDQSAHELYMYDPGFNLLSNPDLGQYNSAPRGITTTAAADTFWVVDASKRIVVYDKNGTQIGQWNTNEVTQPQGIATDGTNLWIVGAAQDNVYYYANGASLRSGTVTATSSFSLASGNNKASDMVTDGQRIWVTDEGTTPKVYVYSMTGSLLGSWTIDSQNVDPSGIALDPVTRTFWIVDRHTAKVYQYPAAADYTSGSHSAASQFALAAGDINPEGITDPTIPIAIGDTVVNSINPAGEIDEFPFTATAGQSISIDFQTLTGGATTIRLIAPDTTVLLTDTGSTADDLNNGPITLAAAGTYKLEVTAAGTRNYQFKLWNVPLTITPITVGQVVTGSISAPGEYDRFTFTGTAGQRLFFDVHGNDVHPFSQAKFAVLKPDLTTLLDFDPGDRDTFTLPVNGQYTVVVNGGIIFENLPSYEFKIWQVPDPSNTLITIGPVVTGSIDVPGEQDQFTFNGVAGQKVLFDIHNNDVFTLNQVQYRLLKPDQTILFDFTASDPAIFTLPATGPYTVIVDGGIRLDNTRAYEFQIWNVLPPIITSITIDQRVQGQITTPAQERGYTFQGTAGQRLVVDIDPSFNSGLGLEIRRPDNTLLLARDWNDRDVFVLDQTGPYTAIVGSRTFVDNTGSFDFTIRAVPADETRAGLLNTPTTANLAQGQRITYTIAAQAGDQLLFDVQNNPGRVLFSLRAPNGTTVLFSDQEGDVFVPPLTQTGTYTLTATTWSGSSVGYDRLRSGNIRYQLQRIPQAQPGPLDSRGTEFWLAFPNNNQAGPFGGEQTPILTLYIAAETATTGVVRVPGINNFGAAFAVPAGELVSVSLPPSAELVSSLVENKGVQVLAFNEVTVYGFNEWPAGTDAYLGLPTDAVGSEYVVMSYPGVPGNPGSSLGVVATQDVTTVEIKPAAAAAGHPAGVPFQITLQRGQTFYLPAQGAADLTGTTVTANRPISAFGSNFNARIPDPLIAANHLIEQLPPVSTWGRRFVTVPFATRTGGDVFRFLAARDGTEVRVNGALVATLNRGQFYEQILTAASEITANQPLLVAQFAHSSQFDSTTGYADPTMMLVPPYEQFLPSYTIAAPTTGFNNNFVNVVVATSGVGTVKLDGAPISAGLFVPIGSSGQSGAQVPVTPGAHRLEGSQPFGVFSYGFDQFDAYGYVGGTSMGPVALATGISLTPESATLAVGTLEAFQATVTNQLGQPLAGVRVDFAVSGPNATTGFAFTDTLGHANFSYSGALPGTDSVTASVGTITDASSIFWSATPPSVVFRAPDSGSEHVTGSSVLITGTAQVGVVGSHIAGVTINGHSVDSLDAAGNFFATVQIAAGANSFTVAAIDSLGQTGHATLSLVGIAASTGFDFAEAQDVTAQAALSYVATSYNRHTKTLNTQARLTNEGQDPLRGPVLAVFDRIDPASVTLATSEGTDPAGHPWISFDSELGSALAPSATSQTINVRLANPEQQRFEPFVSLHAAGNLPPAFTSIPVTVAVVGRTYVYAAAATDPNSDTLTYRVMSGPSNMVIDSGTGLITWVPTADQTGDFQLQIEADDGFGGVAKQQFQVQVVASYPNRPPIFQSAPQTLVAAGANYVYQPVVTDADGDTLQFFLDSPSSGISINSTTGRVDFPNAAAGSYLVTIRAEDGHGGRATQTYALTVGAGTASGVAQIVSTPPVRGVVGELYIYVPHVIDSTTSTFVFSLPQFPAGMTLNTATGEIRWTPAAGQTGLNSVTLQADDQHGGVVVQRFAIDVAAVSPNQPPVFDSAPPHYATEGTQFVYLPAAHDPEGQSLSFVLDEGPTDATFNTQTGQITWTPAHSDLGFHRIRLRALDSQNAAAEQTFFIEVRPPNAAPQFTSPLITTTVAGSVYRDLVTATDADDALTFSVFDGPSGMSIDRRSGLLFWHSTIQDAGPHPVTLRVTDDRGAYTDRTFTLTATTDDVDPVPFVELSEEVIDLATTPSINVNTGATDNVGVTSLVLALNGNSVPLTGGHATFAPSHPGLYTFVATATDAAGNIGTASKTLRVLDPSDMTPPVINVTSPSPGAIITYLTDVLGSVSDDNLEFYRLQVSPAGADEWTTFFEGHSNVTAGLLGTFDPTLLQRDIYDLRVLAQDVNGQQTTLTLPISIEGQAVLGNFTLQFTDLSIPLAGIPIEILRTYDTLDASRSGDFGYGWRLGFREPRIHETVRVSAAELAGAPPLFSANPFREGTRVYLTNPTGRRVGFTFAPTPEPGFLGTIWHPHFVADPGVFDTLSVQDIPLSQRPDGTFTIYLAGFPFNPSEYFLTTKDQLTYHYDQFQGLLDVHDRNDIALTFSESGITSSVGQSIQFHRDAQGRIHEIIDPAGHPLTYTYDAAADLTAFEDQVGNVTSFTYLVEPSHYLDTVIDPLGRPTLRADYDANGRNFATTDALNNQSTRHYDVENSTEVVGDALGHEGTLIYDERGNIVAVTDPRGGETATVYNEDDLPISVRDAGGYTTTLDYDERGNLTRITSPLSSSMQITYNAANQVETTTDPLGRQTLAAYDAQGNLVGFKNADGVTTSMTYDTAGRQTSFTNGNNETTTFTYAAPGNSRPTTIAFADGAQRHLEYNALGQVTRLINENGVDQLFTYDGAGRMLSHTDGEGQLTTLTYEGQHVASIEDPLGRITQFKYDDAGRLIKEIGPGDDHVHQMEYNALNQLVKEIDPLGRERTYSYDEVGNLISFHINPTWNYEYDLRGNRTKVTDGNGHATRYEYDAANRLVHQIDALGGEQNLSYDDAGNLLSSTDANGHTTSYTYDNMNRTLTQTNPLGDISSWTYDFAGNTKTFTDTNGHTTEFFYDTRRAASPQTELTVLAHYHSRLIKDVDALGGTTRYEYDGVGNVTRAIDPLNHATDYTYDGRNMVTTITDPLGGEFVYGYDAHGNLTSYKDALGRTTTYTYDDHNHLDSVTDPLDGLTTFVVDAEGNVTSQTDALYHTTTYTYDALDRLKTMTDPLGGITKYEYDNADNLLAVTDPLNKRTTQEFDALDRLVRTVDPLNHAWEFSYDAVGNQISQTDPLGRQVLYTYDDADRLTSITDAAGGVMEYTHDGEGNLLSASDAAGNTRHYTYDAVNQRLQEIDPLGHSTHYAYDLAGNLTRVTDRNGRERLFSYDALDRESEERWSTGGGVTVRTISYTYDAMDNPLSVSDPDASYQFTYDARDRVSSADNSGTPGLPHVILQYGYDAVDNLTSVRDDTGVEITSTYNANNWLASRSWTGPGVDPVRADFSYNARGGLIGIQRFTGQVAPQLVSQSTLTFDDAGRMTQLVHGNASAQPLVTYTYAYDIANQLVSETHHGQTTSYQYDDAGQLIAANHTGQPNEQYAYDASGNRTGGGAVTGPGNQVLSDGTFNYGYDLEGNLISKTSIATGNVTTFSYDYRNRLTSVEERTAGGALLHSAQFTYDPFDHRIGQTVDGVTTTFVYSGERPWADFDANGLVIARYLYGDEGADDLLARQRAGEGTVWYLTDHLFSVRDLMDAGGQIVDHVEYDSFGNVASETQPTAGDRFKFTGREYDPTTGLYYYRSRFYDPGLGRFLTEDSFGLAAGDDNFYRYAFNAPNNFTDPTGHEAIVEYALILYDIASTLIGPSVCLSNHGIELGLGYDIPYTDVYGVVPVKTLPGPGIPTPSSEWLHVEIMSCAHLKVTAWANGVFGEMATLLKFFNVMANDQPVDCVEFESVVATGQLWDHYLKVVVDCNDGPNKIPAGGAELNTRITLLPVGQALGFKEGSHENCFVAGTQVLMAPYITTVVAGGAWAEWYAEHRPILAAGILALGVVAGLAVARRKPKRDEKEQILDEFFADYEPKDQSDSADDGPDSTSMFEMQCQWFDAYHADAWPSDDQDWQEPSRLSWPPSAHSAQGALLTAPKSPPTQAVRPRARRSRTAAAAQAGPRITSTVSRRCTAMSVLSLFLLLAGFALWNPFGFGSKSEIWSSTKNIEDVKPGDQVVAWDEDTGEVVTRRVVRVFHNTSDHLRILQIRNANGTQQQLETTDGHPFWVPNQGWIYAGRLHQGDAVRQADGSSATVIASIYEGHPEGVSIFNFEVEDSHTYCVAEGHGGDSSFAIVVHNASEKPASSPFYSTWFEANLTQNVHYPGSPGTQFREGNRQLYQRMQTDPSFAKSIEAEHPGITRFVQPGPRGGFSGSTPAECGLTWHHVPNRPGLLRLVPVSQHRMGGAVQRTLHPNRGGGMKAWGGGYRRSR